MSGTRHIYLVHKKTDALFMTQLTKKGGKDSLTSLFPVSELGGQYIGEGYQTVIKAEAFLKDQIKLAIQKGQAIGLMLEFNLGYTGCDVSVVDVFLKVLKNNSCPLKYIILTGNGNVKGEFGILVKIDETTWASRDLNDEEQKLGIKNASRAQVNQQLRELGLPLYDTTKIKELKPSKADYERIDLVGLERTKSLPETKVIGIPPKTMQSDPSPTKIRPEVSRSDQGPVRNLFGKPAVEAKFEFTVPLMSPNSQTPTSSEVETPISGNSNKDTDLSSPESQSSRSQGSSAGLLNTFGGVKKPDDSFELPPSVVQSQDNSTIRPASPSVIIPGLSQIRLSGSKTPEGKVDEENNTPKQQSLSLNKSNKDS